MAGRRALVVGLGRFGGGVGVTKWLVEQGARVTITDLAKPDSLADSVAAVEPLGVDLRLGGHEGISLDDVDLCVINPAVPKKRSSLFHQIAQRGIPWTTEINLFCVRCPAYVVGVTGTFGKSTTCAMLAHVLAQTDAGDVYLGGNIGRSLLGELEHMGASSRVVLELSDAQLQDTPDVRWVPDLAVVTNIFPHHLERHDSFRAYVNTKLNLFRGTPAPRSLVVGPMHPEAKTLFEETVEAYGVSIETVADEGQALPTLLPGKHNQANARCVVAAARSLGIDHAVAAEALATFRGLPHRLESLGELDGIRFVNDSKATSPSASLAAADSLSGPLVLIVGGQHVDGWDRESYARKLAGRCRAVLGMGEMGDAFTSAIREWSPANPEVATFPDVKGAFEHARTIAREGDAVLFSPGAPSYDLYANYCERGDEFRSLFHAHQLRKQA
jgi:UDP-N-acetylmuramoylalanine--D-glutamate ligase